MVFFIHNIATQQTRLRPEQHVCGESEIMGTIRPQRYDPERPAAPRVDADLSDRILEVYAKAQGNLWAAEILCRSFEQHGEQRLKRKSKALECLFIDKFDQLVEEHPPEEHVLFALEEDNPGIHLEWDLQKCRRLLPLLKNQVSRREFKEKERFVRQMEEGRERAERERAANLLPQPQSDTDEEKV